ncbi:MAG: cation-transporting P-type ATPase, partial [Clostridia bacterium]
MKHYFENIDNVLKESKSTVNGLTSGEAAERIEQFGQNKLAEGKKTSLLVRFLTQLKDPMLIILIVAAIISGITSVYSGEGFADVIIIFIVVLINAVLGVYQESKAEKAIEALQKMTLATTKTLRDGHLSMQK